MDQLRQAVNAAEAELGARPFVSVLDVQHDGRTLHVALTARLRTACRKGRVWASAHFFGTLKNAAYGFNSTYARSRGGRDGIFLLDRTHQPRNEMMRKVFDRFLDRPDSGAATVAKALDTKVDSLLAVRLVSHHLRLLGVLHRGDAEDWLILVDYDQ